ncbi:MAG: hypothetical protein PHX61_10840 [Alphaproteobacteria bacterium]|nr:hypothetical protein [Alphaproteobacteria bacterium]
MPNCSPGNILVLAYAVRGDGNSPTITNGWTKLGGGNHNAYGDGASTAHRLYFASRIVTNSTEIITLTQSTTDRIYMVCSEYSGVKFVKMRNGLARIGNANYTVTGTKSNTDDAMVYGVTSYYYLSGRLQSCTPDDLEKIQGDSSSERLACWFDDGGGALEHSFRTCNNDGQYSAVLECVQLLPIEKKYLLESNGAHYTVSDNALVEITPEPGLKTVDDVTIEQALWVDTSAQQVQRDAGSARSYVFPISEGQKYKITLTAVGDCDRLALSVGNPRELVVGATTPVTRVISNVADPVAGAIVEFTAAAGENWCTYHASATGQEPETKIEVYTSAMVNGFLTHGVDDLPPIDLIMTLVDPSILYWQNSTDALPTFTATVAAEPPKPQIVTTSAQNMSDPTIIGISSAVISSSDDVLFSISFDDGVTWWVFTESAWAQITEPTAGMTKATMEAITAEQWNTITTSTSYKIRFVLPAITSYVANIAINYAN